MSQVIWKHNQRTFQIDHVILQELAQIRIWFNGILDFCRFKTFQFSKETIMRFLLPFKIPGLLLFLKYNTLSFENAKPTSDVVGAVDPKIARDRC